MRNLILIYALFNAFVAFSNAGIFSYYIDDTSVTTFDTCSENRDCMSAKKIIGYGRDDFDFSSSVWNSDVRTATVCETIDLCPRVSKMKYENTSNSVTDAERKEINDFYSLKGRTLQCEKNDQCSSESIDEVRGTTNNEWDILCDGCKKRRILTAEQKQIIRNFYGIKDKCDNVSEAVRNAAPAVYLKPGTQEAGDYLKSVIGTSDLNF